MALENGYYVSTDDKHFLYHEGRLWETEPSHYCLSIYGQTIEWRFLKLSFFQKLLFWIKDWKR